MGIPVKLEVFEGPLDLLLHLIEKNKIDILIITLDQRRPAADFLCAVVKRFKHITLTKTVRVEEDMLVVELQL